MNSIIRTSFLKANKLNNQSLIRNYNNSSKPYEEVASRFTENRRFGYKSRYHEAGLYFLN